MRTLSALFLVGALAVLGATPSTAQNLFINPGFTSNVDGWSVTAGGAAHWSSDDAASLPGSGSLELENTAAAEGAFVGAFQCVAVVPGATYDLHAKVRLPASQASLGTSAGRYSFYSAPGCPSANIYSGGGFGGPGMTDRWEDMTATLAAPAAARSLKLQLGTVKTGAGGELTWHLDDAFVGVQGSTCPASETDLCLADGRFKVSATWKRPGGQTGAAHAVQLTRDTGYFWFFSDTNVEMVVKALNGCGLNSRWWVFAAGLTNVRVDWTVTDLARGTSKTYTNPQGVNFAVVLDTAALATCP